MSFENSLAVGVGQLLAAQSVGVWSTSFGSTDTAIVFGDLPAAPTKAIGLTPYPLRDDGNTGLVVLGLQVFMRAQTLAAVMDLRDAVRNVLHNRRNYSVGGVPVSRSWRQMASPQGPDSSNFQRVADSYYFLTGRQVLY